MNTTTVWAKLIVGISSGQGIQDYAGSDVVGGMLFGGFYIM